MKTASGVPPMKVVLNPNLANEGAGTVQVGRVASSSDRGVKMIHRNHTNGSIAPPVNGKARISGGARGSGLTIHHLRNGSETRESERTLASPARDYAPPKGGTTSVSVMRGAMAQPQRSGPHLQGLAQIRKSVRKINAVPTPSIDSESLRSPEQFRDLNTNQI